MKRIFTALIALAMLASSVPASFAEGEYSELTLESASPLTVSEDGYIENLPEGSVAAELAANFKDKDSVTVTAKDGTVLTLLDEIGSDATVSYVKGDKTYKTFVVGDVNGDASFSAKDVSSAVKKLAGYDNGACVRAINVNGDENENGKDISKMLRKLAGNDETFVQPSSKSDVAEYENSGIGLYFTDIMNRYAADETDIYGGSVDKIYRMAKYEIETAQIAFTSDADYKSMTLEMTDLVNENGAVLDCQLYYGYYYTFDMLNQLWGGDWTNIQSGSFVDPIVKYDGTKFDLSANSSKLFYARIHTWADTEAGFYKATVNLKDSEGNVVKTGTLRVYVWNFVLDETPASASAFNIDYYNAISDAMLSGFFKTDDWSKVTTEQVEAIQTKWYDFLLDNKISAYILPYGQVSDKNDEYVHDPRVTSFCVVGGNHKTTLTFEDMAALFEAHKDDEVWLDKAYIYTTDEPCTLEQFDYMDLTWNTLKELMPDIDFQIVTPLAGNNYSSNFPNGMDFAERTANSTNILCPQTYAFTEYITPRMKHDYPDIYPQYAMSFEINQTHFDKYGEFSDRYAAWGETGNYKMWWYVCVSPQYPYANWFTSYRGEGCRVLLWQQYMNNIDGILYWDVNFWARSEKDATWITRKKTNSGDGNLIYPMSFFGTDEMAPSVRFEYVRDSFEDFQYMTQLENVIGREAVMEFVNNVTTGMLYFTEDDTVIMRERDNMGFMLESVSN